MDAKMTLEEAKEILADDLLGWRAYAAQLLAFVHDGEKIIQGFRDVAREDKSVAYISNLIDEADEWLKLSKNKGD